MARTRRNFSAEFKTKVVLDILNGSKSTADVCREYNLKPDLVSHWKNQFLANAAQVFESATKVDPQQARIEELERLAPEQSRLAFFKSRWSTSTRMAHFCGRILNRKVYDCLTDQAGSTAGDFFPAYRSGILGESRG